MSKYQRAWKHWLGQQKKVTHALKNIKNSKSIKYYLDKKSAKFDKKHLERRIIEY